MTPQDKQAARDRIAALRTRYMSDCKQYAECRAGMNTVAVSSHAYLSALEALVDELTAPEPEDLTRDLERSITKVSVERACGVKRNVRVTR